VPPLWAYLGPDVGSDPRRHVAALPGLRAARARRAARKRGMSTPVLDELERQLLCAERESRSLEGLARHEDPERDDG
jgi:hypothetical protein